MVEEDVTMMTMTVEVRVADVPVVMMTMMTVVADHVVAAAVVALQQWILKSSVK